MTKCVKVKAPLVSFDKRSIRTITRGNTRILIGCPEGQWMSKAKRCKVGTPCLRDNHAGCLSAWFWWQDEARLAHEPDR